MAVDECACRHVRVQVSDAALRVLFDDVDLDHGGTVGVGEFVEFIGAANASAVAATGCEVYEGGVWCRCSAVEAVARCGDGEDTGRVSQQGEPRAGVM